MIKLHPEIRQYKETDILLCNLLCFDKKGFIIYEVKESVLFCKFRGLYADIHYTRRVPKMVNYKTIQIKPIRVIGTANEK